MKRVFPFFFAAVIASACGSSKPGSMHADRLLAEEELLFLGSSDLKTVRSRLEEASLTAEHTARADFLLADLLDATGEPAKALDHYFKAIEASHGNGGAPMEAVAASMGIVAIRDRVEGFNSRFEELLSKLGRVPGRLPLEAWYQLMSLELGLSRLAGKDRAAEKAADSAGCIRKWRAVGPRGPWTWSELDKPEPPGAGSAWPAAVNLGPGRGKSPVREVESSTCSMSMGNPALPLNGATWAVATIVLDAPKRVRFRLQTSGGAVVFAQGKEIFRRDPRVEWPPHVSWFEAALPAGAVIISIMIASDGPSFGFSLAAMDDAGRPAFESFSPKMMSTAGSLPFEREEISPDNKGNPAPALVDLAGYRIDSLYARLKIALWWDDIESAWEIVDDIKSRIGEPPPIVLLSMAEATGVDPSLPGEVAYERARSIETIALEKEPRLWQARAHLADRELNDDRFSNAVSLLEAGVALSPNEPDLQRRLLGIFAGQGWTSQAEKSLSKLQKLQPTSCLTKAWRLSMARRASDFAKAGESASELAGCDASSPALAEELSRAQDWSAASRERTRLFKRDPTNASLALDVFQAMSAQGDETASLSALKSALDLDPVDEAIRIRLADIMESKGDGKGAREVIEQGLGLAYGFSPSLETALAAIDKRDLFAEFRLDGLSVIKRYTTEGHAYDTAAVFVLDRAVYMVGSDGGSIMLVHTITQLKTDEAVEQYGELSLPEGAKLLIARTIKSDGSALEPEDIENKKNLSFPDLKPGDFIESEYAVFSYPSQIYPGGFDTERFYFENFETAFHLSEIIVIVPSVMETIADPRGSSPKPMERSLSGMKVLTWRARGVLPFPAEPYSPSATEYLPSIRVTSSADWNNALAKTRDLLADKERPSRHIDQALSESVSNILSDDPKEIRKAIYKWVTDEIEPGNDLLEQASHIIVRKSGNRARAFLALMRAAGYQARLAFVKPSGADDTKGLVPDLDDWGGVAVLVPGDGWIYLDQDCAPYGYLPPNLRNRPAIFVENGERAKTDGGKTPRDSQKINIYFTVKPIGGASGKVIETVTGALAARWRSELQRSPKSEWKKRFQEAYLSSEIQGATLLDLRVENLGEPDKPLVLQYEVEAPGFAGVKGPYQRFDVPFSISLAKQVGGLPVRATPLVLATWIDKEVSVEISLPDGMIAKSATPGINTIEDKWGRASAWYKTNGTTVRAGYKARVEVDRVLPGDYQKFLAFTQGVDRISKLEISANREP
jgi:tetratricopeptide (TPR) repeat protein